VERLLWIELELLKISNIGSLEGRERPIVVTGKLGYSELPAERILAKKKFTGQHPNDQGK